MAMGQSVIDYLYRHDGWLVSPIGCERGAFPFITMPHIDFCRALGFPVYRATDYLELVEPGVLPDRAALDRVIAARAFDYAFFDDQLCQLDEGVQRNDVFGGGVFGPLTVASDVVGVERTLRLVRHDPAFLHAFLDYVTGFMVQLAQMEAERGAGFFWVAEPVASLLPPALFEEFSGMYLRRIFESANVPGFLHVCGPTIKHTRYLERTGAQVLSIDYLTDLPTCLRMVGESTVVMGNVSPIVLAQEDRATVESLVEGLIDSCRNFKNVILSSGCSLMPGTPPENVDALFDVAERYPFPGNGTYRDIRRLVDAALSGEDIGALARGRGIDAALVPVAIDEAGRIARCRDAGGCR